MEGSGAAVVGKKWAAAAVKRALPDTTFWL
jgi:hypothetical protein